jgi:hypothetical protein
MQRLASTICGGHGVTGVLVQVPQHVLNSLLGEGATEEKGENARMVRNFQHLGWRTSAGLTKLGQVMGKGRLNRQSQLMDVWKRSCSF